MSAVEQLEQQVQSLSLQSYRSFVRGFLRMMSSYGINRLLQIARRGSLTS